MITEAELGIRIGDTVECCLDCHDAEEDWYTGVIENIQESHKEDGFIVSIKRNDGMSGTGTNKTWRTDVTEDTLEFINLLRKCVGKWNEAEN